jgi:lipopolysaccharide biosynthesis regulator YciM
MIRAFSVIFIFVVAMFYLSYLNPDTLQLHITPGITLPIYTSLLILSSIVIGAFLTLTLVAFRDTRRGFVEWREKSRLKKKEKVMDLYSQGVNDLLSKKRDQALKSFQKILEWNPKNTDVLLRIGEVYRYKGNLGKAIEYHSQARSLSPDNLSVLFALAKDFRRFGQPAEAAEIYQSILKIDPRNVGAFLKLREIYDNIEAWDKVYALQKGFWGLKKSPKEKRQLLYYQFMAAGLLNPEKDQEKLIKIYSDLIKSDKMFSAPYLKLGKIYDSQGNGKEAMKIWKKGFKETGAIPFLEAVNEHYRKKEDPGSIIKFYKEAINRYPEKHVFKFLLGKFYYRLEMIDDALEVFERLIQQGFRIPIMRQMLGDIYHKRGRTEDAFLEYRESVNFIRPVMVPYSCETCSEEQEEWSPRCPNCGNLETLTIQFSPPEKYGQLAPRT